MKNKVLKLIQSDKALPILFLFLCLSFVGLALTQTNSKTGKTTMEQDIRLNSAYINTNIGLAPAEREMFLANDGYDSVKTFIQLYESVEHNPIMWMSGEMDTIGMRLLLLGLYSVRSDFLKRTTEENWVGNPG